MSKKHLIFYDDTCPLCQSIKSIIMKLDWFHRLEWLPVQKIHQTNYRFLRNRNLYDEIHMITSTNEIKAGFYTVRKILMNVPLAIPFAWILFLPLADKLGVPLYQFVSENRYEWFGRLEENPS
ncbi:thiol-disulfide oxidoreductase DCC family protein [Alkalihalobacillus sp. NPDC078783]